jgi:CubicO group peptidase (beta-lactamase class C family)
MKIFLFKRSMSKRSAAMLIAVFALFAAQSAIGQSFPKANPAEVGMSAERLKKIATMLKEDTAKNLVPGAVILVVRHGKIAQFDAEGVLDPGTKAPMSLDAIFRIYSMSKAITSVTAMTLFEEGKLSISDPVAKYIPAFQRMKVIVEKTDAGGAKSTELVNATRQMTIQDLLRHTSGITYGFFGAGPGKKAYNDAGVLAGDYTNAEFADKIAKLPLSYQPGTTWDYSHSTDILGRVVEVVSGKTLLETEKERVLGPLGMTDTGFYVSDASKHPRITEPFPNDRTIGVGAAFGDPRVVGKWESGGGGMVSTATDYARFLQMLLNGGSLNGKRILSPKTVAFMTSDHTEGITPGPYYLPGAGYGFGLGFAVRKSMGAADEGSVGEYNWNGVGGTNFWVDPKEDMFVVFMIQSPRQRPHYMSVIRNMVYAAIEK